MTEDEIGRLQQFFGGYFHEDWHLDVPDADSAVYQFVADTPSATELKTLAALVQEFSERECDDKALDTALSAELWCRYYPMGTGVSTREWLQHVAKLLREASRN